jgi:hypothetical protein
MTKQISISISDYVYQQYLIPFKSKNLSQYVERLIVVGSEAELRGYEEIKLKMISLLSELRNKDEEIKKLKANIGRLQSTFKSKKGEKND